MEHGKLDYFTNISFTEHDRAVSYATPSIGEGMIDFKSRQDWLTLGLPPHKIQNPKHLSLSSLNILHPSRHFVTLQHTCSLDVAFATIMATATKESPNNGKKRVRPIEKKHWSLEWKDKSNPLSSIAVVKATAACYIVVEGRGTLRSLSDTPVHVNGYFLNQSEDPVDFDSPSWFSWATVEFSKNGGMIEIRGKILRVLTAQDSSARPTVAPSSWVQTVSKITVEFQKTREQQKYALFGKETLEDDSHDEQDSSFIVAVCGAKNVGKSTCLRYAVNRMLQYSLHVAVLDADAGQPELSPPGMLSLTIVDEPLLQPPHSHFLNAALLPQPAKAYYYGSASSATDPERYLECIRQLVSDFRENHSDIPLFVNLDGWVKGLGQEILQALVQEIIQPTHVIQILGELQSRIFDLTVNKEQTCLHVCRSFDTKSNSDELSPAHSMSLPPSSLRTLRLLAYFLPVPDNCDDTYDLWDMIGLGQSNQDGFLEDSEQQFAHRLAALRPYVVPMENVDCTFSQQQVAMDFSSVGDQNLVWKAMNGSIVGLCRREESVGADLGDREIRLPPCIGLGIVRAVDHAKELAYVLTRVSPNDLQSVNILCLGSICLPLEASFRGVNSESFSNVTFEKDGKQHDPVLGAEPMKSRNSIGRKSQNN